jgi:hypothetical protein
MVIDWISVGGHRSEFQAVLHHMQIPIVGAEDCSADKMCDVIEILSLQNELIVVVETQLRGSGSSWIAGMPMDVSEVGLGIVPSLWNPSEVRGEAIMSSEWSCELL